MSTDTKSYVQETGEELLALYDQLAAAGVELARAQWSGGGDEGEIHTIDFVRMHGDEEIVVALPMDLERAFEDALGNVLDARFGGWGNDAGGYGSFEANVVEKTTDLMHAYNTEDSVAVYVTDLTTEDMTDADLDKRIRDAWQRVDEAKQGALRLEAVWAGRKMLAIAAEYSAGAITGYGYDVEWNYDDESSYFPTVSVRPQVNERMLDDGELSPEDDDALYEFGVEGVQTLFGDDENLILSLDQIAGIVKRGGQV